MLVFTSEVQKSKSPDNKKFFYKPTTHNRISDLRVYLNGSGGDCKLGITVVRPNLPNLLLTPEMIRSWTDKGIGIRRRHFFARLLFRLCLFSML